MTVPPPQPGPSWDDLSPEQRNAWLTQQQGRIPSPPMTHRRIQPAVLIGAGIAAFAALLAVIVLLTSGGRSFTMNGSLTLLDGGSSADLGGECRGFRGYSDLGEGASVTVYDEKGAVIATGTLQAGVPGGAGEFTCQFPFTIEDVPGGSEFYQVEVSHRGKVTVSAEEAREEGAQLSLGNF